jgi:predicted transcriptional regulator
MSVPIDRATLAERTTEIVAAFVAHNQLQPAEIGNLIGLVAGRLASLGAEAAQTTPSKPEPVIPVRRSVGRDQITCLICGKAQKLLKRHLAVAHELTPAQYRELFGLKPDYPMVAPSYAQARSELAHAVTGAVCVASCCALEGSVAAGIARIAGSGRERVRIEHPSGTIDVVLETEGRGAEMRIVRAGLVRTARKLMAGEVYVPARLWEERP